LRLRRRLLVFSAPVAVLMVVAILKSSSVVIAGGSAATDFAHRDNGALRSDVAVLSLLNVVEPAKAYFAAGDLAVLDGRLEDADAQFANALARTDAAESCPTRINLEIVRETLGDRAAGVLDGTAAAARYRGALSVVDGAPAGCFGADTAARLHDKIDAALVAPPPPPPPVAEPPPPPPPPPSGGSAPDEPDRQLRLNPGSGDPLDRLQQILRDAAG
jgi:hypothetical protein